MKRVFLTLASLFLIGTAMAATPQTGTFVEEFDGGGFLVIDNGGGTEAIRRPAGTTEPLTNWAWGAYSAGTTAPHAVAFNPGTILFKQNALVPGSYFYSRFDTTSTDFAVGAAVPSVIINASGDGSKVTFTMQPLATPAVAPPAVDVALLIRDNAGWHRSSAVNIADFTGGITKDIVLVGTGAVTWTAVSNTDIDQVDNAGEEALVDGAASTPNLGAIEGIGLMILSTSNTTTNGEFWIDTMTITAAGGTSAVENWRDQ